MPGPNSFRSTYLKFGTLYIYILCVSAFLSRASLFFDLDGLPISSIPCLSARIFTSSPRFFRSSTISSFSASTLRVSCLRYGLLSFLYLQLRRFVFPRFSDRLMLVKSSGNLVKYYYSIMWHCLFIPVIYQWCIVIIYRRVTAIMYYLFTLVVRLSFCKQSRCVF